MRVKNGGTNEAMGRHGSALRKMRQRHEGCRQHRSKGGRPRTDRVRVPGLWTPDEYVGAAEPARRSLSCGNSRILTSSCFRRALLCSGTRDRRRFSSRSGLAARQPAGEPSNKEKREENQGRDGELIIGSLPRARLLNPSLLLHRAKFFIVQSPFLLGCYHSNKPASGQKFRYVARWCHTSLLLRCQASDLQYLEGAERCRAS
jgi:hypothetical protein